MRVDKTPPFVPFGCQPIKNRNEIPPFRGACQPIKPETKGELLSREEHIREGQRVRELVDFRSAESKRDTAFKMGYGFILGVLCTIITNYR